MTLLELQNIMKDEIEVWDKEIDVPQPFYCYPEMTYSDNDDEHYLFLMEKWLMLLPVDNVSSHGTCCVNVYHEIEAHWEDIFNGMKADEGYDNFVANAERYGWDDCEVIADYVEDVFTILAYGYNELAKDFCWFMGLADIFADEDKIVEDVMAREERGEMQIIGLSKSPDWDKLGEHYDLPELSWDASQGAGNVIIRYFYVPALDVIFSYADF